MDQFLFEAKYGMRHCIACQESLGMDNQIQSKVKKYEIYDGITFQWFMCAGILMVGFLSSIVFGDFGMKDTPDLLLSGETLHTNLWVTSGPKYCNLGATPHW